MKTPQQIRNEVKNEVKEQFLKDAGMQIISWEIGESWDRAIDLTLTEYDKSIMEMIEDRIKHWEKVIEEIKSKMLPEFEEFRTSLYCFERINELNELLSKIGDNSEVEK
jgi:hypothetical protein